MMLRFFKKFLRIFIDLRFAIFLFLVISIIIAFSSVIEQGQSVEFYKLNYPILNSFSILNYNIILNLGLNHIFNTWWFFLLLFFLSFSLVSCTFIRQVPLVLNSKKYLFKKKEKFYNNFPIYVKFPNFYYFFEFILLKIQNLNFYLYQKNNVIYGFRGLIGRISPILVHISLILILAGSFVGTFLNFKAEELLPKGEIFTIQNSIEIGQFSVFPRFSTRVNDFWVEYKNNKIKQFYSNLSILDSFGIEIKFQTLSVNNPFKYKNIDFYQSDWNLLSLRIKDLTTPIYQYPLFLFNENSKQWISWIQQKSEPKVLIFDQLQNAFFIYDTFGNFLSYETLDNSFLNEYKIIEILPLTGLLLKYNPGIIFVYFGFGVLIITTFISYIPYIQLWIYKKKYIFFGSSTNRGKIQLEIQFENFFRIVEKNIFNRDLF